MASSKSVVYVAVFLVLFAVASAATCPLTLSDTLGLLAGCASSPLSDDCRNTLLGLPDTATQAGPCLCKAVQLGVIPKAGLVNGVISFITGVLTSLGLPLVSNLLGLTCVL